VLGSKGARTWVVSWVCAHSQAAARAGSSESVTVSGGSAPGAASAAGVAGGSATATRHGHGVSPRRGSASVGWFFDRAVFSSGDVSF
jgi:hypothetical protein